MYKVLEDFTDKKDETVIYRVGDEFPKDGSKPTKTRINELSGNKNSFGHPLIEEVEAES